MFELSEIKFQDYLARIGCQKVSGGLDASFETLQYLHRQHALTIPFEGISPYIKQPVYIDGASITNKLISKQRGGYCYEMNGLFSAALRKLGFAVSLYLAEIMYDGSAARSKDSRHAMLVVSIENKRYLCDVGYGRNGLLEPILLPKEGEETTFGEHRLRHTKEFGCILDYKIQGVYALEYRFDPIQPSLNCEELEPHNQYMQHSTQSPFINYRILTRATPTGRITLVDKNLRIVQYNKVEKRCIQSLEEYKAVLKEQFGIMLEAEEFLRLTEGLGLHWQVPIVDSTALMRFGMFSTNQAAPNDANIIDDIPPIMLLK